MVHHAKRQVKSYKYAAKGVKYALDTQINIWVHLIVTLVVILLAYYLDFSVEQYLILVLTIAAVITAELFNTALEELVNHIEPNHHPQAGIIKDLSAAAVLVTATAAAIIGLTLFIPAIWLKLGL